MTTAFTSLGADDVNTDVECLLDVLGVADHVHHRDAGGMELVNGLLGGNAYTECSSMSTSSMDDVAVSRAPTRNRHEPTAQTKSEVFSSMITSINWGNVPK